MSGGTTIGIGIGVVFLDNQGAGGAAPTEFYYIQQDGSFFTQQDGSFFIVD